jgi:hypothetical protein
LYKSAKIKNLIIPFLVSLGGKLEGEFNFMNTKKEIWKTIPDYQDYQVSNLGNLKSLKFNKEKKIKQSIGSSGYYLVSLSKKGIIKKIQTHQLIAMAFLNHKPCGYKLVVDHIDNNKLNNNVSNLRIVTNRENTSRKNIGSSKYIGVFWCNTYKKWQSRIRINGDSKHLGYYKTEYDAHLAYKNKLKELNYE